jgi:ketosteroid isomerase-like protein
MQRFYVTALVGCLLSLQGAACFAQKPEELTNDPGLLRFLNQLAEATYQFNVGNPEPYLALLSATEDLTLMGAAGGMEKGIAQIRPRLVFLTQRRTEGERFEQNEAEIEYISIITSGNFAYTVQIERRRLSRPGQNEPEENVLRATHVLRKENGDWKLLHRHADPLVAVAIPGLPSPQE